MGSLNVAVIGGGAAGFFSAIHVKLNHPSTAVTILEKSGKLLSKVRISGGGRCNVTNGCTDIDALVQAYPRGGRSLKRLFHLFNTTDTMSWFESRGVPLYTQDDGRVFPTSDDSASIIDCLLNEARRLGVTVQRGISVKKITPFEEKLMLDCRRGKDHQESMVFDKVIVATGGSPTRRGLDWLEALGHRIETPVPSLFTFNMPDEDIKQLMGVAVDPVQVQIQGARLKSEGPLLITHWGMSGPAILKLSAYGARDLYNLGYKFTLSVNWTAESNHAQVQQNLQNIADQHAQKMVANMRPYGLPKNLWLYLLDKAGLAPDRRWETLGKKGVNKLTSLLTQDLYTVKGTTTFKEEFVTCGGVSLKSVDLKTMQSKVCKNLYFAGEVLDIDAITGGYNFQAAWTTGFIAGRLS